MANVEHGILKFSNGPAGENGIHVGQNYVFATEGLQDAQVITADDIGKFAFRSDNNEMWCAVTAGTGIENWRKVTGQGVRGTSLSQDEVTGATFVTKTTVQLLAINATWAIAANSFVSHSNTVGRPQVRLRETTADVSIMTRDWENEMKDTNTVLSPTLNTTIITTVADSPPLIIALQSAVSGTGTLTISDAGMNATVLA